jgi:hypothetical protein
MMFDFLRDKRIYPSLEEINMKLSDITAILNEIKANLTEASEEITTKLDALAGFLDSDPDAAIAILAEIREKAQSLANIVPDA